MTNAKLATKILVHVLLTLAGVVTPRDGQFQENLTGLSQIQLPLAKARYANTSLSLLVTLTLISAETGYAEKKIMHTTRYK